MNNPPRLSYGYGYVLPDNSAEYLVGRVLTIIEALGLKETQEKSLKDLLRNEIYKITRSEEGTICISPNLNDEIHRVDSEIRLNLQTSEIPMNYSYKFSISYTKEEDTPVNTGR